LSCSETVIADMKTVGPVPVLDSIVVVYASRQGKCWNPELYNQLDLEAPVSWTGQTRLWWNTV